MSLVIILVGIPGSGKTTILEETLKFYPHLKVINYGDMMLEEASLQQIDKDALRKLPLPQQQKMAIEAAKKIVLRKHEMVCIDTNALIRTPMGYCPGIPEELLRILKPSVIAMVECAPYLVHERRKFDKTRVRDVEVIEQIEYHQQISRSFCLACAAITGAIFTPIQNQTKPVEAAQQLLSLIELLT